MNSLFDRQKSKLSLFQDLMKKQRTLLSGLITVKGGLALVGIGLNLYRLVYAKAPTKSTVKVLKSFAYEVYRLTSGSSLEFTIKYLKVCSILLQQYVSKHENRSNTRVIGDVAVSVTRTGLPRIIPRQHRLLIRRGNPQIVTFYLSLFNLYRFLESRHKTPDYKTITDRWEGYIPSDMLDFIPTFWKMLSREFHIPDADLKVSNPQVINSVSVSIKESDKVKGSSLLASMQIVHSFRYLANFLHKKIQSSSIIPGGSYEKWIKFYDSFLTLYKVWWPELGGLLSGPSLNRDDFESNVSTEFHTPKSGPDYSIRPNDALVSQELNFLDRFARALGVELSLENVLPVFGRLCSLKEAAGKVRVIAIVDPITNWLLKPLHDWLFAILRAIPQDGTFDQERPIRLLIKKSKGKFIGSCDMSAATDRLPVLLQAEILSHILGKKVAYAWMNFLCSRPYSGTIWYSVGQPMGALSSWAALAITHHFMWQYSAWRAKWKLPGTWYSDYAVLGDDSSSLNRAVVNEYLLLCQALGVKINLAKSLLSPKGCLEFAKRFFTPLGDCSPVSIGEILISKKNFASMANWTRKRKIRLADLFSIMGYKHVRIGSLDKYWSSLPSRTRNMLVVQTSPWGPFPSPDLWTWVHKDGLEKTLEWENYFMGVNLVILLDELGHKLKRLVYSNMDKYNFAQLSLDKDTLERLKSFEMTDPSTFRVLMDLTIEPHRKMSFGRSILLLLKIAQVQREWRKRVFLADPSELNQWWQQLMELETKVFNIAQEGSYQQTVEKPFSEPSARSVVQLWNKLRNPWLPHRNQGELNKSIFDNIWLRWLGKDRTRFGMRTVY